MVGVAAIASAACSLLLSFDDFDRDFGTVDAADDAFVSGIRVALLVGGGVTLAALVTGALIFPKGTREDDDEADEADALRVDEEVP
jgi:hypothetical protein